jgi:glycosyltransferase involved in cell wall biosynthesis
MLDDWSIGQKYLKKRAYLALAGRELLEHAEVVHCTAVGELRQAEKWLSHQRMQVIPLAVDLRSYEDLPGTKLARAKFDLANAVPASAKLRTVLFLSRIHYKKGLDVLLKAITQLDAESVSLCLLIAGSGSPSYMAKMQALAEHLGISSIVQFLGPVDGELKRSLYQLADVFALPTSQENFGLVFAEALACATPVITTRHVDIWPELEESGGVVVAERTPTDFARKILGLLRDDKRRRAMGEAGRRWAFSYLNSATIRVRFEQMYREMMTVT